MSADFAPRLDILPPPQRRLWDELRALPAIALHLGHRQSVDFDFFGNKSLDPAKLLPAVPFLAGAIITQREPNTVSCTVDRGGLVKLSFFGVSDLREALDHAPPGIIDPRSWAYWNAKMGRFPPPPLPTRRFG